MNDDKFLVVLGLDSEGKPHAARFKRADEATVGKAAGAKGFKIGIPKSKEATDLVAKLPEGKLFDSGKGLVPFTAILTKVQRFSTFGEHNDPYRERDFGAFEMSPDTIFWKIDYYNRDLSAGSENPSDCSMTTRVMTIMRADEY